MDRNKLILIACLIPGTLWAQAGSTGRSSVAVTKADGSDVTLGSRADAKSTATDTTAVTMMQVLKEISAMAQAPALTPISNFPTTVDTNSGNKSASTIRMVIATDQPQLTSPLNQTPQDASGAAFGTRNNPMYIAMAVAPTLQNGLTKSLGPIPSPLPTPQPPVPVITNINPCQTNVPGDAAVSQAATGRVITGRPGLRILVCHERLTVGTAEQISEFEGSGSNCATGAIYHSGSSTAANGEQLAANGGFETNVPFYLLPGNDYCIQQAGSARVAGKVSYLYVP